MTLAKNQTLDMRGWLLGISVLIIGLDRWTKHLVSSHVAEGDAITVIPGVFRISHILNPGAAFSLFVDSPHPDHTRMLLVAFSLIAAIAVFVILLRIGRRMSMTALALALVLGGDIGNMWDRIRTGLVIDFLEVHIVHYHWPDFNVADSAIVVGGILLMLASLFSKDKGHA